MPMSDKKLAELARGYKEHRVAGDKLRDEILTELNRRGVPTGEKVDGVEKYGVRIRKKARRIRRYSVAALKEKLSRKHRTAVIYEDVRVPVLDDLVKRGELNFDDVKSCLESDGTSEPYIDVRLLTTPSS